MNSKFGLLSMEDAKYNSHYRTLQEMFKYKIVIFIIKVNYYVLILRWGCPDLNRGHLVTLAHLKLPKPGRMAKLPHSLM